MGQLSHVGRMQVLLLIIIPLLLQGRSIVRERNDVIKQALIPTLVNIIGNETVQIVEYDEGFDTEVFFMYVTLAAAVILLLFLVYTFLPGTKGKKSAAVSKPMETGTTNDDVDYEWIPRSALKTPGSNKTSPRQRKAKRAGSDTE